MSESNSEPATLPVAAPVAVAPVRRAAPPPPPRVVSPLALKGNPQMQADWLSLQIGKVAKAMAQTAQSQAWSVAEPVGIFARLDVASLMLGYKMVSVGYQLHNDPPGPEVMRLLRGAITVPLHRAMQSLPEAAEGVDRIREVDEHLKQTTLEINQVLKNLREKKEGAFAPYYPGLSLAFGGATPAEQAQRFARPLNETFARLEQAMATQGD